MNLREKYGEWGLILGATEGVGKAFCEKIAAGGMNVVMVGLLVALRGPRMTRVERCAVRGPCSFTGRFATFADYLLKIWRVHIVLAKDLTFPVQKL